MRKKASAKATERGQGIGAVLDDAANGYVCISVNYRLDADKQACVEDVKCAIRWLRAHAAQYNVDPNRIGAAGNSAGGHLALMLAVCPASAGLEGDGPYQEHSSMVQAAHCSSTPIMPRFRRGKGSGQDVRKIQPMTYISADVPPLYLIHGTLDEKAPLSYVDDFVKALREAGAKDITYKRYADGTGHGAYVKHIEEARPEREAFFARTLRKAGAEERGAAWPLHVIDCRLGGGDGVRLFDVDDDADMDGDGDLDVLTTEENFGAESRGMGVIWYENPHTNPSDTHPSDTGPLRQELPSNRRKVRR